MVAESTSVGAQRGLLSRKQKHLLDLLGALLDSSAEKLKICPLQNLFCSLKWPKYPQGY